MGQYVDEAGLVPNRIEDGPVSDTSHAMAREQVDSVKTKARQQVIQLARVGRVHAELVDNISDRLGERAGIEQSQRRNGLEKCAAIHAAILVLRPDKFIA